MGFESVKRVSVTDVWWDGIPEARSKETEGCRSQCSQKGRRDSEEFREVLWREVMDCLKGEERNLEINTTFNREPVKLLKDRRDMTNAGRSGDAPSGRILNQLKFMNELEKGVRGWQYYWVWEMDGGEYWYGDGNMRLVKPITARLQNVFLWLKLHVVHFVQLHRYSSIYQDFDTKVPAIRLPLTHKNVQLQYRQLTVVSQRPTGCIVPEVE